MFAGGNMSKAWLKKARWASMRGDYAAAGDLYRMGGELDRSLKMYLKGQHHREAADVAEQLGDFSLASKQFELAGLARQAAETALRGKDRSRAARLFVQIGEVRRAAQIQEQLGRADAAAALYEHSGDLLRAGRLYLEARQPDRTERVLEQLFKQDNDPNELQEILGQAARCGQQLLARGEPERAARWLERAGRSAEAARAWERAGRHDRAVHAFLASGEAERAAKLIEELPPGTVEAELAADAFRSADRWAEAGALYLECGRPSEAAICLERLGCVAEAAWAYEAAGDFMAAASSLERTGDHREAAACYRRCGALHEAARCLEASGDLEAAAPCYAEAGQRLAAAEVYERLGDVDRAIETLQRHPPDPEEQGAVAMLLGRLFERKGLDSLAADHYRKALADGGDGVGKLEVWYQLGGVLERTGRVQEAIAAFRKVLASDANFRDAARRLTVLEQRAAVASPGAREHLPDRYVIGERLDLPLPGKAFACRDSVMNREVMLRRFGKEVVPSRKAAERILGDVRRIAQLHHPAIAAIHDAGVDREGLYIVQERVDGLTLREAIAQEGRFDVPRTIQILTRMAEALDYAHGLGLLARTLRPETIVLRSSGEALVIDFGLVFRQTDGIGPPPAYRPPEARRGERMDPSSDIYLLGIIAWEMLFGAPPPVPDPASGEAPTPPPSDEVPVPDLLRRVLRDCLAPDRNQRVPSAQKLLEELHGTHLLPGALLANRYEILREIGRGGMGSVFQARDLVLDEPVALKVLSGVLDENTERRFIQEIRLTRQINHPNIVRVHTFERWRELRFIVMEYIDGVDLRRWAAKRQPIPLSRALEIVAGVAAGLSAAHRLGIVHRDVKPENVLLDGEGRARLVDFGIARQGDVHLTQEGLVMGSPAYMAPEQIRGQAADQRADLYALGILAYFLIAGREPFESENVAQILKQQVEEIPARLDQMRAGVPPHLAELIARTLDKDPNGRPASVFAFLEELTALRGHLSVITA
jgi:serine/threonine-protein kinase